MIPEFRRQFDFARDPIAAQFALNIGKAFDWTPTLTFATPGDLSVVYSVRIGKYIRIGQLIVAWVNIQTTTFTHTTSSGALQVTGLPLNATGANFVGSHADTSGLTAAAGFLGLEAVVNTSTIQFIVNDVVAGSRAFLGVPAHATGTNVVIRGMVAYSAA